MSLGPYDLTFQTHLNSFCEGVLCNIYTALCMCVDTCGRQRTKPSVMSWVLFVLFCESRSLPSLQLTNYPDWLARGPQGSEILNVLTQDFNMSYHAWLFHFASGDQIPSRVLAKQALEQPSCRYNFHFHSFNQYFSFFSIIVDTIWKTIQKVSWIWRNIGDSISISFLFPMYQFWKLLLLLVVVLVLLFGIISSSITIFQFIINLLLCRREFWKMLASYFTRAASPVFLPPSQTGCILKSPQGFKMKNCVIRESYRLGHYLELDH